ncbi:MAG: PD-(D/E)XK nuclease family protein [Pseudohongiellaceae bacterium]
MPPPVTRIELSGLRQALAEHRLILVPNHRTRDVVLQTWAMSLSGPGSFRTPDIHAIDVWIRGLWEQHADRGIAPFSDLLPLDPDKEALVWLNLVEASLDTCPLLNPVQTARLASQAYQYTRQWFLDDLLREQQSFHAGNIDVSAFLQWKGQFENYCRDNQLISLVDMTRQLLDALREDRVTVKTDALLVNFFEPPPLYQALLEVMTEKFGASAMDTVTLAPTETSPESLRFSLPDMDAQLDSCVQWAKEKREDGGHIGIVTTTRPATSALLQRKLRRALNGTATITLADRESVCNEFSGTTGLLDHEISTTAIAILALNQAVHSTAAVCDLLRSVYLPSQPGEMENRLNLDLHLRRYAEPVCRLAEIRRLAAREEKKYFCPHLSERLQQFSQCARASSGKSQPACTWSDLFEQQLAIVGWPGPLLTTTETGCHELFNDVLARFRRAGSLLGKMTLSAALARLKLLCLERSLDSKFSLTCPITLLSPEEAAGLRFDHLWILDMDDDNWPPKASPNPMLPYDIQKQYGLPSSHGDLKLAESRRYFELMRQGTMHSFTVSHRRLSDDRELRPSALTQTLPEAELPPPRPEQHPATELATCEVVSDVSVFPLQAGESPHGGSRLLTNQSLCPFRGFGKHRLLAEELPEIESGLGAAAKGSAIHLALETFWQRLRTRQALVELSNVQRDQRIQEALDVAMASLGKDFPETMTPRFAELERRRLHALLTQFIVREEQRPDFVVEETEKRLTWKKGDLELGLMADRIDRLADGSLVLIDYKTGASVNPLLWEGDRPEDLQLALYYTSIVQNEIEPVNAVAVAQINSRKSGYLGVATETGRGNWLEIKRQSAPLDELAQSWPRVVEQIAGEFISGSVRVNPLNPPHTCRYCGLQPLCRIGETVAAGDADGELP